MRRIILFVTVCLFAPRESLATREPLHVEVSTPRIRLGDLVRGLAADLAGLDVGPAPLPGSDRLVTRGEIASLFVGAGAPVPARLQAPVRVSRRSRRLTSRDIDSIVRSTLALRRGVTIESVRGPSSLTIADGWDHVTAVTPRLDHRPGQIPSAATLSFLCGDVPVARISVNLVLRVSPEGAAPDLARGATVTLTVSHGLVEVSTPAHATVDADIGDVVQMTLASSGRMLRARLVARDHAIVLEEP
ncbi:MAG: flagella basal body P-ring formation protein FlgA [Deltaproteobacteria bacterium]